MTLQAAALRRDIARRLELANEDELHVLDQLLIRLELGREHYGHLDLSKAHDWEREEAEELLDMRVYQAIQKVVARQTIRVTFDLSDTEVK